MKKTKVFAVSIVSIGLQNINQVVCAIKAVSEAEAIGRGVLIGLKKSPLKDGWGSPTVIVTEIFPKWFNEEENED